MDTKRVDDWSTTERRFDELLGDQRTSKPRQGFEGRNFMTDEVLGYVETARGDVVEISSGMFLDDRLYGVTFSTLDPDHYEKSKCCHSWAEVMEALR